MPSDARVKNALAALAARIGEFRSAVAGTLDRARRTFASETGPARVGAELGAFASGRIDPAKFAMISVGAAPLDVAAKTAMEAAAKVLDAILTAANDQFVVKVPPGDSVGLAIRNRFKALGAAFAAGAVIEHVRRRTFDPARHALPVEGLPFERWSALERKLAPPLVVDVDGSDLDPFEIAPFLDGCVQLVLTVNGACAAAPLARLISPGVFVAQCDDIKGVESFADFEGPAVIALMTDGARFTHDPRRGGSEWLRLQVTRMPHASARRGPGLRSTAQQREDVGFLRMLAEQPRYPANPPDALMAAIGADGADPVERLTAWVLDQAATGTTA